MRFIRGMRAVTLGCLLALAGGIATAVAQSWPTRFVTLVVPFGAGSAADTVARILAGRLSEVLGQQMIVENVVGGGGMVGINRVAKAPADGYQIAFGGRSQLQLASDTARAFVAAARAATDGARVFHLGGPAETIADVARAIEAAAPGVSIGVDEQTLLPFPEEFDGAPLEEAIGPIGWTPIADGVRQTIDALRAAPG